MVINLPGAVLIDIQKLQISEVFCGNIEKEIDN